MRMLATWRLFLVATIGLLMSTVVIAQISGRRSRRESVRTDYPVWKLDPSFEEDCFTFVRIRYGSTRGRGGNWDNDYPDCDLNFSYRLQQLTSLNVDPNGKVLRLTDSELYEYPFIYMSNVQNMYLSTQEATGLRTYLLNGGFLMADDFWTPRAWRHVKREMEQVFPNSEPRELRLDHETFHLVYDLKKMPRVPSIFAWQRGLLYEPWHGDYEGDDAPHFQGYFDDNGRLMALFCHNNDIWDGWEREGENHEFFQQFSAKVSYPLGVNIVT